MKLFLINMHFFLDNATTLLPMIQWQNLLDRISQRSEPNGEKRCSAKKFENLNETIEKSICILYFLVV